MAGLPPFFIYPKKEAEEMGKVIDGKYIYSMEDCRCEDCLHYEPKAGGCQIPECCCLEEKMEALRYFPPDGYADAKRGVTCRG
jgi:hypothetical protein